MNALLIWIISRQTDAGFDPRTVMKLAAAKLPVTTEMIDRNSPPRVGYEAADVVKFTPKIITAGEHALAVSALQASIAAVEMEKPVEVVA